MDDDPFTLRVRLVEGAYSWQVSQGGKLLGSGMARTPAHGRALARRAAQDLTTTLRPAPVRRKSRAPDPREPTPVPSFMGSSLLDRAILAYFGMVLLSLNLGFSYYGLIRGTATATELLTALMLLAGGAVLHAAWVNTNP